MKNHRSRRLLVQRAVFFTLLVGVLLPLGLTQAQVAMANVIRFIFGMRLLGQPTMR